eukprot:TRINITY_DN671_c0_g4_i8.p1 TRINITY_DN671_c0_g4~~TRINITY_DN671_c0_g4_i8.p1  ORF type:complete len:204 (+),score=40.57 TRINITY_DN671_c0_g4_i8:202-813(+)
MVVELRDAESSHTDNEDNMKSSIDEDLKEILQASLYPFLSSCSSEKADRSDDPEVDSNFLLAYLMTPQVLQLSVNKSPFHHYMFKLVPSPLMHLHFQQHYYFVWSDLDTAGVVSSLDITHIKSVRRQDNERCFAIVMNNKRITAVMESSFVICCETADDCYKYITGLNYFAQQVKAEFENMPLAAKKRVKRDLVLNIIPTIID